MIKHLMLCLICVSLFLSCGKQESSAQGTSILRISAEGDPQTLDPRRVRDLPTATVIHMLYEGLMRNGADAQPAPALADKVTISPDQLTYTFTLRKSAWSDGRLVTASDFAETWKSLLDPKFPSPNAYQLYPIRGAQAAKEGTGSLDGIGVEALNDETLVIHLDKPTPYFLSLLATHFYYPVHAGLRSQPADASALDHAQVVTNGPFMLKDWQKHNELDAIPNPHYWDSSPISLDQIKLVIVDNPTALQLFQRDELDWTGSPISTLSIDALADLKRQGKLEIMPAAGVYFFRVNTEMPPFTSPKLRRALALALNRADLVEHVLQGNQQPAFGIVPPSLIGSKPWFRDQDVTEARKLFQEAMQEQGLTAENFPPITLYYATGERSHKIAQVVQQQWKEALGVEAILQSNESKVYFERLKKGDYQLGLGSWFADFRDPISFLEVFKSKDNGTNNTRWENVAYTALLDTSALQSDPRQRNALLQEAEKVFNKEMPVIPLFYASYNYVKRPSLKGVYFSELGYLDFKHAYFE